LTNDDSNGSGCCGLSFYAVVDQNPYNESQKVLTLIAPVYSMRSAGLSQLPGENLGVFHRFEMRRSVKLTYSALGVGLASFFASGDQMPVRREKHGDQDNPTNFTTCRTVIV
jgi:hypothetical protein